MTANRWAADAADILDREREESRRRIISSPLFGGTAEAHVGLAREVEGFLARSAARRNAELSAIGASVSRAQAIGRAVRRVIAAARAVSHIGYDPDEAAELDAAVGALDAIEADTEGCSNASCEERGVDRLVAPAKCPGSAEYGHGLSRTVVHSSECCGGGPRIERASR